MPSLVPSFVSKLSRAETHLAELSRAIESYSGTHPYEVVYRMEGQLRVPFLKFTSNPDNTDIPVIAGDVVQNLYAGLNHLAVLLARRNRGSIMFPIFWQGVWEPAQSGENGQLTKDRERWTTYVRDMRPQAVTILKQLQPPDDGDRAGEIHKLRLIQRLANTDRHKQLNAIATGLSNLNATITRVDGTSMDYVDVPARLAIVKDGARIFLNPGELDVVVHGDPQVVIHVSDPDGEITLPDGFQRLIEWVRERVTGPLGSMIYP